MKHVAPVRRELGLPTIMNVLGPLTNPAGARRQIVGVADPDLLELIAGALLELGHSHAMVVLGQPGLDEISPIGDTDVIEVADGKLTRYTLEPEDIVGERFDDPAGMAGGSPEDNARTVAGVLDGTIGGVARAAVVLNAAAAIYIGGRSATLKEGAEMAAAALAGGTGARALDNLRNATRKVRN
jgi:anthranilate phosphoribosyltransferase